MLDDDKFQLIKRYLTFEDIDKNTLRIREYNDNINRVVSEQIIKWYKFKDKKILSRLSVRQLKNLIKRCEEVIQDKESEAKNEQMQNNYKLLG